MHKRTTKLCKKDLVFWVLMLHRAKHQWAHIRELSYSRNLSPNFLLKSTVYEVSEGNALHARDWSNYTSSSWPLASEYTQGQAIIFEKRAENRFMLLKNEMPFLTTKFGAYLGSKHLMSQNPLSMCFSLGPERIHGAEFWYILHESSIWYH